MFVSNLQVLCTNVLISACSVGPVPEAHEEARGGGLYVGASITTKISSATVLMNNETLLVGNTAKQGNNIWVASGGVATYLLPAPAGRW